MLKKDDEYFLREALREANKAEKIGEVPVGAVVTFRNKIVGRGYNKSIVLNDPTAHAEIIALREASKKTDNYRLINCKVYVTMEPCPMCIGAMIWARVSEVVFGCYDKKAGACGSVFNIAASGKLNHKIRVKGGIIEKECRTLIQDFFKARRSAKKLAGNKT